MPPRIALQVRDCLGTALRRYRLMLKLSGRGHANRMTADLTPTSATVFKT